MPDPFDVVVIGGGHNGLVAAGLLAKRGARVVVLERRSQVGGAAVTEQPWGPRVQGHDAVVRREPDAADDRCASSSSRGTATRCIPQGPYFVAVPRRALAAAADDDRRQSRSRSSRDATPTRTHAGTRGSAGSPTCSARCSRRSRRALGSRAPARPRRPGAARVAAAPARRAAASPTSPGCSRSSIADLLDDYFESPQMHGVLSVSGVIGTWAGPRSPGTAYVMAHHKIGDVGDGELGSWGFPRGGMGGVTRRIAAARRESFGATVRTDAPVAAHRRSRRTRRAASCSTSARSCRADVVDRGDASEDHVPRPDRPSRAARRLRRRHRAVEDPQRHREGQRRRRPAARVHARSPASTPRCTAARSCSPSRSTTSRARSRTRSAGTRRGAAVRRHLHPVGVRPTARARGPSHRVDVHAVGAARVGRRSRCRPSSTPTPIASIARVDEVAPGFTELDPAPAGHRPVRDGARVRPRRRQHLPRRAVARPAVPHAPGAGLRRLPHADRAGCTRRVSATHGGGGVTGIPGHERGRADRARSPARGGGGVRRTRASRRHSLVARRRDAARSRGTARGRGSGPAHDRRHRADRLARHRAGDTRDAAQRGLEAAVPDARRRSPSTTLDVGARPRRCVDRDAGRPRVTSTRCGAATWSDGRPVTAADVVSSLQRARDEDWPYAAGTARRARCARRRRPHRRDHHDRRHRCVADTAAARRSRRAATSKRVGRRLRRHRGRRQRGAHGRRRPARAGRRSTRSCSAPTATRPRSSTRSDAATSTSPPASRTTISRPCAAIDGAIAIHSNDGDQWYLQAARRRPDPPAGDRARDRPRRARRIRGRAASDGPRWRRSSRAAGVAARRRGGRRRSPSSCGTHRMTPRRCVAAARRRVPTPDARRTRRCRRRRDRRLGRRRARRRRRHGRRASDGATADLTVVRRDPTDDPHRRARRNTRAPAASGATPSTTQRSPQYSATTDPATRQAGRRARWCAGSPTDSPRSCCSRPTSCRRTASTTSPGSCAIPTQSRLVVFWPSVQQYREMVPAAARRVARSSRPSTFAALAHRECRGRRGRVWS